MACELRGAAMTTAPQTDRAAIEALARELTDEQWDERFAELDRATWNPGTRIRESTRALLAYLDETWAGLTEKARRQWGQALHDPQGHYPARIFVWNREYPQSIEAWKAAGLVRWRDGSCDRFAITPLGRACLRRGGCYPRSTVIWADIPGWPGYQVSDTGDVRRILQVRSSKPKVLSQAGRRYATVALSRDGDVRRLSVHRLVLEAFVGPCPAGHECRHLNGNRRDNRLANLAWGTQEENQADRVQHGCIIRLHGEANASAKLTAAQVVAMRESTESHGAWARRLGVGWATVHDARVGKTWAHLPLKRAKEQG